MEIDPIAPGQPADTLALWLAVRDVLEAAAAPPVDAEAIDGVEQLANVPLSEPAAPGADSDFTREASAVQTAWRAPAAAADLPAPAPAEQALATPAAQSEFALPAALLAPATLTGLRVDPGVGWQLPPGQFGLPAAAPRVEPRQESRRQHGEREEPPQDEPEVSPEATPQQQPDAGDTLLEAAESGPWCETLSRVLRAALAARIVPQALLAAADQWKRGRCVVLACPQGDDPAGPAWAFVLWPRAHAEQSADGVEPELALRGLQVEARLTWSAPPRPGQWCHVRVIKEHHPRTGRQLVLLDDGSTRREQPVPCEVQLGPVLARSLRWCEVRVRIQAAQRFWAALGQQWSMHVVVCAQPLLTPAAGSSPC